MTLHQFKTCAHTHGRCLSVKRGFCFKVKNDLNHRDEVISALLFELKIISFLKQKSMHLFFITSFFFFALMAEVKCYSNSECHAKHRIKLSWPICSYLSGWTFGESYLCRPLNNVQLKQLQNISLIVKGW